MKAFFAILIACVVIVLIASFGLWLTKARSVEESEALTLEEDYRAFISSPPPETTGHAGRSVELLTRLLDAKNRVVFRSTQLIHRVEFARSLALSNTVAGLEAYSGMSYGTNIQAWQDWLEARSPKVH